MYGAMIKDDRVLSYKKLAIPVKEYSDFTFLLVKYSSTLNSA